MASTQNPEHRSERHVLAQICVGNLPRQRFRQVEVRYPARRATSAIEEHLPGNAA